MKWCFFLALILSGCVVSIYAQSSSISVDDFEQTMNKSAVQLLDVRTAAEYQKIHLPKSLQADWLNQKQFIDRIQHLDKNKPVLLYCASGIRSGEAMQWMKHQGFSWLANLEGGLSAWHKAGKNLIKLNEPMQMLLKDFLTKVSTGTILVDLGAEWCPPCKKMEPVLQELQKEIGANFSLLKVDGGIDIEVMKYLRVEGLPTFIVYKNGLETWRRQGVLPSKLLKEALLK